MAPRVVPPATPASPKQGRMMVSAFATILLLTSLVAGLMLGTFLSQTDWWRLGQFTPAKVEQPAGPTEEKKTSAERLALLLPAEEQVAQVEQPVPPPPPAEEQVVEDNQRLLVDLKTRCEGLADRIPVGKMSAEELNQLMNWCDSARQTPPQQVEEQPAEEQQKQLAGNYQPQDEGLTETDSTALKGLLDKMHGPAPAGFMYQGYETQQGYRPKPNGCTEHKVHDKKLRRTFIRVICG